jgi:hypothetical protein
MDDIYRLAKMAAAQGRCITLPAAFIIEMFNLLKRAESTDKEQLLCQIAELKRQIVERDGAM